MKLSISLNDDLLKEIDEYCEANFMTRSGLISFACSQVLNQQKANNVLLNFVNQAVKANNANSKKSKKI